MKILNRKRRARVQQTIMQPPNTDNQPHLLVNPSSVLLPAKGVESAKGDPASAELHRGVSKEPTDVSTNLKIEQKSISGSP